MTGRNVSAYLQFVKETKDDQLKHREDLELGAELEALRLGYSYQQLFDTRLSCLFGGGNYLEVVETMNRLRKKEVESG